ncbi:MAG TPA: hypothetical protein G4O18_05505 [Dehalococcoidia bacterium]|nr:hypothetical protein [Dehalococcoidia bacterium]
MGIGPTIVSLIWFVVRIALEMPSSIPLFAGPTFAFADAAFAAVGIAGIGVLVLECFSSS